MKGWWKFYTSWAFILHVGYFLLPRCVPNTFPIAVAVMLGAEVIMKCVVVDHASSMISYALHYLTHYAPLLGVYALSRVRGDPLFGRQHLQVFLASLCAYVAMYKGDLSKIFRTYKFLKSELESCTFLVPN